MLNIEKQSPVEISIPELVSLRQYGRSLLLNSFNVSLQQSGDYQSRFKGRGMEFSESRPYEPGDDIRNLDWRVMARTGKAHTKLFREERERPIFFCLDFRAPMFFATRGVFKSVLASRLASLLAWSASDHSDRVGGFVFSETEMNEVKPRRGKNGVLNLIQAMTSHSSWNDDHMTKDSDFDMSHFLLRLKRVARPGSLIFFLSDFRGLDENAFNLMQQIGKHCELFLLFISDPLERSLPKKGYYRFSDGLNDVLLNTFDTQLLDSYQARYLERENKLESLSQKTRMSLLKIATTDDPVDIIQSRFQRP